MYKKIYTSTVTKKSANASSRLGIAALRGDFPLRRTLARCFMIGGCAAGLSWTVAVRAQASLPATDLEPQASAEFAAAGQETRERLRHEAAGDWIGAEVAARNADAHRHRFLELEHELVRLHSSAVAASPSVAPRNPFEPDESFARAASASSLRGTLIAAVAPGYAGRTVVPLWDLYGRNGVTTPDVRDRRQSQLNEPVDRPVAPWRTARGMYATHTSRSLGAIGERRLASTAAEAPREPLRVYQYRGPSDDPSK